MYALRQVLSGLYIKFGTDRLVTLVPDINDASKFAQVSNALGSVFDWGIAFNQAGHIRAIGQPLEFVTLVPTQQYTAGEVVR